MHFSKQLVASLSFALLVGACGGSGENKPAAKTDTSSSATTDSSATGKSTGSAADDKALELIAGSDCTTCHRLHETSAGSNIGPAYDQVAAKYPAAADTTVDRIVKKIISGGSGVWGTVPMTPHPQVKPEDIKTMVTYILSLKK